MKPVQAWEADFAITSDLAGQLIAEQFPSLRVGHLELLGTGWDNTAYIADGNIVFRFPRRDVAARLIQTEARVLPMLAPHLPQPIPLPQFVGSPSGNYPYPFAGYPLIRGITACRVDLSMEERCRLAAPLGEFLRCLHGVPVTDEQRVEGPGDEIRRTDLLYRLEQLRQRVWRLGSMLEARAISGEEVISLATVLANAPVSTVTSCWVHGDLYVRHLLVNTYNELAGVIDWGDVHLGDRALDLSIAYSFLPESAHVSFFKAYGEVDVSSHQRAHFRSLYYGAVLIEYGVDVQDRALEQAGVFALKALATTTSPTTMADRD